MLMTGAKFCAALGVRFSTLPTKLRASRGLPDADRSCDACGGQVLESLGHILNNFTRTHGAVVKRHDRILGELKKILTKAGFIVAVEPRFHTSLGLRKPDLVVYKQGERAAVVDVTITSDMYTDPDTPHWSKCEYYGTPEIVEEVTRLAGIEPTFSSVTISWRGVWAPASARDMIELGMSKRDIQLLSVITVEWGCAIHRLFQTSTHRGNIRPP